jgi:predicted metal-dependent phosphotriesterase family hydrolase
MGNSGRENPWRWIREKAIFSFTYHITRFVHVLCSGNNKARRLPHADAFRQDQLAQGLMRRSDVSEQTVEKILSDNPQRLFHFREA